MDIRVPALENFPLDYEQLALLGEVVALGALIEAVADGIVCRLVTDDRDAVAPLVAGETFDWMRQKINLLAGRASHDADELKAWAARARLQMDDRNLLVHSVWLGQMDVMPGVTVGHRFRRHKTAQSIFKTVEEMAAIRDSLVVAYQDGLALALRLHGPDDDQTADDRDRG